MVRSKKISVSLPENMIEHMARIRRIEGIPISVQIKKGLEERLKKNFLRFD